MRSNIKVNKGLKLHASSNNKNVFGKLRKLLKLMRLKTTFINKIKNKNHA